MFFSLLKTYRRAQEKEFSLRGILSQSISLLHVDATLWAGVILHKHDPGSRRVNNARIRLKIRFSLYSIIVMDHVDLLCYVYVSYAHGLVTKGTCHFFLFLFAF